MCHTRLCRRRRQTGSSNWKAMPRHPGLRCKVGGRRCSLTHDVMCRSAPQFRAIGGPVGRAALRLETGRATCRSRTAQDSLVGAAYLQAAARPLYLPKVPIHRPERQDLESSDESALRAVFLCNSCFIWVVELSGRGLQPRLACNGFLDADMCP